MLLTRLKGDYKNRSMGPALIGWPDYDNQGINIVNNYDKEMIGIVIIMIMR